MQYIHTLEYYVATNNEMVAFVGTWMKLESIILSKITQEQKNQILPVLTSKWEINDKNS